ncbi:MAG: hypothetical protein KF817_01590 [Phycisphaeraceae bacterium]|nr:hypothetical protein [Phycisphaeraceae bacterium]
MADHIPFISGEDGDRIVSSVYPDSEFVRLPIERVGKSPSTRSANVKVWIDPCVDGLDDLDGRQSRPGRTNSWFEYMRELPHFEQMGSHSFHSAPVAAEVEAFVREVMGRCVRHRPAWISVPQLPMANDKRRAKINRALAVATGKWKSSHGYRGRLILPIVVTHQAQIVGKTARNPRVQQVGRCYHDAQADGFWVVDKSLSDDNGSGTLRSRRFPAVLGLHEELNECISSKIRIAGPYWGLNLVLWARGLVDFPAIGIGSGYQYALPGGHANPPSARLALQSLRRRVKVGPSLRVWLDAAITRLAPSHPAHGEFSGIRGNITVLNHRERARVQVAKAYKGWFDTIASTPKAGRSMALFQDLSAAYALGKSLPDLEDEGGARRPESVVEPLMLNCL